MSDEIRYRFIEDGDFIVFEDGRVFKKLDPPVSSSGYKFVRVGKKSYPLHRVVASAFVPNPRKRAGVSQTRLAEALGVTQAAVAQWESGKAEPTLFNLRRLADILGVTTGDLL